MFARDAQTHTQPFHQPGEEAGNAGVSFLGASVRKGQARARCEPFSTAHGHIPDPPVQQHRSAMGLGRSRSRAAWLTPVPCSGISLSSSRGSTPGTPCHRKVGGRLCESGQTLTKGSLRDEMSSFKLSQHAAQCSVCCACCNTQRHTVPGTDQHSARDRLTEQR